MAQIQCPTLVMHRRAHPAIGPEVARALASGIPGARLMLLEGSSPLPFFGDVDSVVAAVREFLGDPATAPAVSAGQGRSLVTVLFTDMESSTALTQRLGDEQAQTLVRRHNEAVRGALAPHGGREIKHTGDGIMASFPSASGALECAIDIQRALATGEAPMRVRIGLNAGEPLTEEEDLFGTAVQLAARVCAEAEPGTILVSNVVRELAAGKGFLFADRGDFVPRGFEDQVRLYELRWQD
jgi:class 3 adenylate cyclase